MTVKRDPNNEEKLTFCLKNNMKKMYENIYVVFKLKNTEELCRKKWCNDISNFHTSNWKFKHSLYNVLAEEMYFLDKFGA